jgi:anti-sigma regulatory factor (Ser/Thr protein kinase)
MSRCLRERFGADLASVPASRSWARSVLTGCVDDRAVDDALLVVSELTTNALLHAGTAFELAVEADGASGVVHVAVTDASTARPVVRTDPAPHATSGRGMWLIERLCRRWGVERHAGGKRVWCEVAPTRAASA